MIKRITIATVLYGIALSIVSIAGQEITPYKFTDKQETQKTLPKYTIPISSRYTVKRSDNTKPDIIYYMSTPQYSNYPLAVFCGGSSNKNSIASFIHFHRYFLQECMDLNIGIITVEQWGIDDNAIDTRAFMKHYTLSQRLQDHIAMIEHIQAHPPQGWNGRFIFVGCSEGGPLVTSLTERYCSLVIATINWCGASDWSWRDELWTFIKGMRACGPWWIKAWDCMPRWLPFAPDVPRNKNEYDSRMDAIEMDPNPDKEFMGMTYQYHADAMRYPAPMYEKLKKPYLVVAGALDSAIDSTDAFVQKAQTAGVRITYIRVPDMDHYVRKRPDILQQSFAWLLQYI
jgi:pimeloyl-ACP methyl ester carboxylesterase